MSEKGSSGGDERPNIEATISSTSDSSSDTVQPRQAVEFPPTRWTVVLQAVEADETRAHEAIAELCEHYRTAIQGYFRMKCRDPHAADDLASQFVLHLLEKNRFRKFVKRENMRFRNYLSRALKYFLYDHLPEKPGDPVEHHLEKSGEEAEIEKHVDAQMALATHQRAMTALLAKSRQLGKAARVERLSGFVLEDPEPDEYRRAAADLAITVNALYQAVFRLRNDYYEQFRAEVAQTVGLARGEVEEETRYLMALVPTALAQQGGH